MLVVKKEFAHSRYGGVHPLTGADLTKVLWKDLSQDILLIIYNDDRNRINIFDSISEPEQVKVTKETPKNVNTTAPSTIGTIATTTTSKGATKE